MSRHASAGSSSAASRSRGARPASSPVAVLGKPAAAWPATAVRVPSRRRPRFGVGRRDRHSCGRRFVRRWRSGCPGEHSGRVDGDGSGTPHGSAGGRQRRARRVLVAAAVADATYGACTQSSAACTYVIGPSGKPIPSAEWVEDVTNLYVLPNAQSQQNTVQTVFTPEGAYPATGIKVLPLTISAERGRPSWNTIETLEPGPQPGDIPITILAIRRVRSSVPCCSGT